MRTQQADGTEVARVQQVAASYRASGYQITFASMPDELLEFLAGYQPNFVAERDGEHVVLGQVGGHATSAAKASAARANGAKGGRPRRASAG